MSDKITPLIILLLVVNLISCQQPKDSKHHTEKQDQKKGYLMPGLKHGLMQSPINILSGETAEGGHNITLNFSGNINKVENLGHTIQLDFEPGNTVSIDGKVFEFKQMHFHTPSEHMIDGMTFPMEMHVVNIRTGQSEEETPEYLVIAYLFKMGKEHPFIKEFIDLIPEEAGKERVVNLKSLMRDTSVEEILEEWKNYYAYKGSLTTPPYTETVRWCVLSKIFEASPAQIVRINELEGDNARQIQAVYDREVDAQ